MISQILLDWKEGWYMNLSAAIASVPASCIWPLLVASQAKNLRRDTVAPEVCLERHDYISLKIRRDPGRFADGQSLGQLAPEFLCRLTAFLTAAKKSPQSINCQTTPEGGGN
jgi:hypothetical protein